MSTAAPEGVGEFYRHAMELLRLGEAAVAEFWRLGFGSKLYEPSVTVTLTPDGKLSVEFYSYCLDLDDGGRSHDFRADSFIEAIDKLKGMIELASAEVVRLRATPADPPAP